MQVKLKQLGTTKIKLSVKADTAELDRIKEHVLKHVGGNVKVPGFRPGKAPDNLLEKQIDPSALQAEFLEHAVNDLYVDAIKQERLRPAAPPEISITKFVPFSTLEFTAELEAVGDIKLPNYKNIKLSAKKTEVTAEEVTTIINNLRERAAEHQEVQRAAKNGDEVTIDFKGADAATKEPIAGADGTDYPLALGSKSFIPGFEDELIGLKPDGNKTFNLTFPKDYNVKDLQSRKVAFEVTVKKVNELKQPKADDAFAASVGPFKTLAELKADIKKQLVAEKEQENARSYENELLQKIAEKSTVDIPATLVDEEINRIEEEEKRDVVYRGQTWQEHLDAEGVTAEEHRERQRPPAELRVKAGLILGEIADKEGITVTPEELEIRMQLLKGQYPDVVMQAELDKPESRRDIHSRMMTEKTLELLRKYAG